jgi:hypothetical protein
MGTITCIQKRLTIITTNISVLMISVLISCGAEQNSKHLNHPSSIPSAERALTRAEYAYRTGDYSRTIEESGRVIKSPGTSDQYYQAVKLIGLASCKSQNSYAALFAWKRLTPKDRQMVQNLCQQQNIPTPRPDQLTIR